MNLDSASKGASRYVVGKVKRFNQRNEMIKRAWWDPNATYLIEKFASSAQMRRDKPGYTVEEQAFQNATWSLERNFARGNMGGRQGMYAWESQVKAPSTPADFKLIAKTPQEVTRVVKTIARFYGASLVGVCELNRTWVYSHYCNVPPLVGGTPPVGASVTDEGPVEIPEEYKYAISLAYEMDYDTIRYSPTFVGGAATGICYSKMAFSAHMLAQYIRLLGYKAIPMGNDTANSIPIAIDAGLGELSRMGLLVTPQLGPRLRLNKVFTNMPLVPDKPIEFGVWEFCRRCGKCAKYCPSQAIMLGEPTTDVLSISNRPGMLRWPINAEKCLNFWATNGTDCCVCIRVCPFNKPRGGTHRLVRMGVKHAPWLGSFFLRMDDLLGYGKKRKTEDYWQILLRPDGT